MARIYSRAHGQSGSKKIYKDKSPSWTRYKPKEVELLIIKLAKEGKSTSQIGTILRDTYGIASVRTSTGKKITEILETKKLVSKLPEDLTNLIKRALNLRKHMEANIHDMAAKRGLEITESKVRRLLAYYKKANKVEKTWNYNPKTAGLYIQ